MMLQRQSADELHVLPIPAYHAALRPPPLNRTRSPTVIHDLLSLPYRKIKIRIA